MHEQLRNNDSVQRPIMVSIKKRYGCQQFDTEIKMKLYKIEKKKKESKRERKIEN